MIAELPNNVMQKLSDSFCIWHRRAAKGWVGWQVAPLSSGGSSRVSTHSRVSASAALLQYSFCKLHQLCSVLPRSNQVGAGAHALRVMRARHVTAR